MTDPYTPQPYDPSLLSFPYPQLGTTIRSPGNGCLVCVHRGYCPAIYWFRRKNLTNSIDEYVGRQCASWSTNPADIVRTVSQYDLNENARRNYEGVLREPDDSGMTEPTNAGYYRDDNGLTNVI